MNFFENINYTRLGGGITVFGTSARHLSTRFISSRIRLSDVLFCARYVLFVVRTENINDVVPRSSEVI